MLMIRFLYPDDQARPALFLGVLSVLIAGVLMVGAGLSLAAATLLVLVVLALPFGRMWAARWQRDGAALALLHMLLYLQGFHTLEHIVQWVQYYLLLYPPRLASGLISPLNAEIVHFVWNQGVLGVIVVLMLQGFGRRNLWAWGLLLWTGAHTAEHTYLFRQYLDMLPILRAQGASLTLAQGLPGVLGAGGWLSWQELPAPAAFVCQLLPGLVSTPRLNVHFVWNMGELVLLLAAARTALRQGWGRSAGGHSVSGETTSAA
ncbi:MAG TPA: hypothetical protein VFS21_37550 [Roseiflexaceae bacterium]|nr:hypothetical protein [Roseiflexaceae bacterium]